MSAGDPVGPEDPVGDQIPTQPDTGLLPVRELAAPMHPTQHGVQLAVRPKLEQEVLLRGGYPAAVAHEADRSGPQAGLAVPVHRLGH